ncbi:protein kinase family protein [Virgibacillus kekensis]|uniref:Protein kinase family protein n=1 Tax=Virgibacillus kekensis TaxID=202261 RepID=A0ABV9DDS6_9BACI
MVSAVDIASSLKGIIAGHSMPSTEDWPDLEYIGAGRSAVVFRIKSTNKALKLFYPEFEEVALEEAAIYRVLQGNPYYPTLYEAGDNFLLIDYIEGRTLFECLTIGERISEMHIKEVDRALAYAKEKGLTPSDIHLRNIILTNEGNIRLIDVARFRQNRSCQQWNDLKRVYYSFYNKPFFPKRIPTQVLDSIAVTYKKFLEPLSERLMDRDAG